MSNFFMIAEKNCRISESLFYGPEFQYGSKMEIVEKEIKLLMGLFAVVSITVLSGYAEAHLEQQVKAIFKGCKKGSEPDLNSRLEKLTLLVDEWGEALSEKDMHKHIYEFTIEGQVFTLLIPNQDSTQLSEFAKTCWVQYVDWRRSYKDKSFDDAEYLQWRQCVTTVYPSSKPDLLDLINNCR